MKPTKKVEERIKTSLTKFRKVLAIAKDKDVTESDTVAIINDMLAETFGFEKYSEITSELMIRGTFCDLAIKLDDSFEKGFLIECKRVGTDLKEEHMRQAVNYGVNKGIQWVILTNGVEWRLYKLRFEQPVNWDVVLKFNLLEMDLKDEVQIEKLFCICKEGIAKNAREEMWEKSQCFNRFVVGHMLLQEPVLTILRRELKKLGDGISIDENELVNMLIHGVMKRDIHDDEIPEVKTAQMKVSKFYRHAAKAAKTKEVVEHAAVKKEEPAAEMSVTDKLLAEASSEELEQMYVEDKNRREGFDKE